jgi:hypothetical protein
LALGLLNRKAGGYMKKGISFMFKMGTVISTVMGLLVITFASLSWGKVSEFHELINENISAQKELHGEVRKQMHVTEESLNPGPASTMVVESDQTQINTPTSKKMLKFKKESLSRNVPEKKQMDRVSEELNDASVSF